MVDLRNPDLQWQMESLLWAAELPLKYDLKKEWKILQNEHCVWRFSYVGAARETTRRCRHSYVGLILLSKVGWCYSNAVKKGTSNPSCIWNFDLLTRIVFGNIRILIKFMFEEAGTQTWNAVATWS